MNFNTQVLEIKKGGCYKLLGRAYYIEDVPAFTWSNSGIEFCGKFKKYKKKANGNHTLSWGQNDS